MSLSFSDGYIDLDLDNCGGKMFLRVLLNLAMHNYKPLVSGALQLLLRHFSQRQEVLQAFKQVREWLVRCFIEHPELCQSFK